MSKVIYESMKRETFISTSAQQVVIYGMVKGSSYEDAKKGISRLESKVKRGGSITILDVSGAPIHMSTTISPGSNFQAFKIRLAVIIPVTTSH